MLGWLYYKNSFKGISGALYLTKGEPELTFDYGDVISVTLYLHSVGKVPQNTFIFVFLFLLDV